MSHGSAVLSFATDVTFRGSRFNGADVLFTGARFMHGVIDFALADFSGGNVDFTDVQLNGGTIDFHEVGDWSVPPTNLPSSAPAVRLPDPSRGARPNPV